MSKNGVWSSVNGAEAHRLALEVTLGQKTEEKRLERVLGNPDFDWRGFADRIAAAGLARGFGNFLEEPLVEAQSPAWFRDALREYALAEGFKLAVTRMALEQIREELTSLDATGILLKGAALTVRSWERGEPFPAKTPGDLDILVPHAKAIQLRDALLSGKFTGAPQEAIDPRRHHLEPIQFRGLLVELHTSISDSAWQLPEDEMQQCTHEPEGWAPLEILGPEAFLLHTSVHLGRHYYSFGLKTMWVQLFTLLDNEDRINWDRLARWASRLRDSRRFWIPLQIFQEDLGFPIPPEFFSKAPQDWRQRRLLALARKRMHELESPPPRLGKGRPLHELLILGRPSFLTRDVPRVLGRRRN